MLNEIKSLAQKLGLRLSPRNPSDSVMWNGVDIAIHGLSDSNILHEIAHWQLSIPERRILEDYGLGPGPESGESPKQTVSDEESQLEEERASLLGIAYEAFFGLDFQKTLYCHYWESRSCDEEELNKVNEDFWRTIVWLQNQKFLTEHLPTVLLDR